MIACPEDNIRLQRMVTCFVAHAAAAWTDGEGTVLGVDECDKFLERNGPRSIAEIPERSGQRYCRDFLKPRSLSQRLPVAPQQLIAEQQQRQFDITRKDIEKKPPDGIILIF